MITLMHPNKHSRSFMADGEKFEVPFVEGQQVTQYLHNARLGGLRKTCRVEVSSGGYFTRIKGGYVPKDGDIVRLRRAGQGGV